MNVLNPVPPLQHLRHSFAFEGVLVMNSRIGCLLQLFAAQFTSPDNWFMISSDKFISRKNLFERRCFINSDNCS